MEFWQSEYRDTILQSIYIKGTWQEQEFQLYNVYRDTIHYGILTKLKYNSPVHNKNFKENCDEMPYTKVCLWPLYARL